MKVSEYMNIIKYDFFSTAMSRAKSPDLKLSALYESTISLIRHFCNVYDITSDMPTVAIYAAYADFKRIVVSDIIATVVLSIESPTHHYDVIGEPLDSCGCSIHNDVFTIDRNGEFIATFGELFTDHAMMFTWFSMILTNLSISYEKIIVRSNNIMQVHIDGVLVDF